MVETLVEGTRRTLELACAGGAPKVLLLSSGAVYGRQPHDMAHMDEEYAGGPDVMEPSSSYAEGKRAAELLGALYAKRRGLKVKIARGFAFVGPYLPLDAHFAAGNFIRDGLAGKPIVVAGDGTPYRSYLYGADLAYWLWTILLRGTSCRPYNVGSERAVSIRGLAEAAAAHFGSGREVIVTRRPVEGAKAGRYVPSTARAREELHLEEHVDLAEAVRRTVAWHERRRSLR